MKTERPGKELEGAKERTSKFKEAVGGNCNCQGTKRSTTETEVVEGGEARKQMAAQMLKAGPIRT